MNKVVVSFNPQPFDAQDWLAGMANEAKRYKGYHVDFVAAKAAEAMPYIEAGLMERSAVETALLALPTKENVGAIKRYTGIGFERGKGRPLPVQLTPIQKTIIDAQPRNEASPESRARSGHQRGTLETRAASAFELRSIRWVWQDRFALGKFSLIGGLPDKGKGLTTYFMMAAITAGAPFPCGEGNAPQGSVLYFTAEDDISDTVVPRLMAAGANLDRVHIVQMMRDHDGKGRTFSMVTDLEALRLKLEEIPDIIAVFIDPISAYQGVGKVNSSMSNDVRGFLTPLTDMAAEKGVAIIGVTHFNKKVDVTNAMLRMGDSIAWTAAARGVYAVMDDPEDDKQRLFVKAKNNIGSPDKKGLSYMTGSRVVGIDPETKKDIWAPYIIWGAKYIETSATEAMQAEATGHRGRTERREAKDFLMDRLADGPVTQEDVITEGEAMDISKATLRRAKKDLNIVSKKGKHIDSKWTWELPPTWKGKTHV